MKKVLRHVGRLLGAFLICVVMAGAMSAAMKSVGWVFGIDMPGYLSMTRRVTIICFCFYLLYRVIAWFAVRYLLKKMLRYYSSSRDVPMAEVEEGFKLGLFSLTSRDALLNANPWKMTGVDYLLHLQNARRVKDGRVRLPPSARKAGRTTRGKRAGRAS